MRTSLLFLVPIILGFSLWGCKKEEVGLGCSAAQFVGTFDGRKNCDGTITNTFFTISQTSGQYTLTDEDGQDYSLKLKIVKLKSLE